MIDLERKKEKLTDQSAQSSDSATVLLRNVLWFLCSKYRPISAN